MDNKIGLDDIIFFFEKFMRHQDDKTSSQLTLAIDAYMNSK